MQHETNICPVNYRITIEPDMTNFRFAGRLELLLSAGEKTDTVRLNCIDLSITRCILKGDENAVNLAFRMDPDEETLSIFLPEPVFGDVEMIIDYYGEISDKMAGFYRSSYHREGKTRVIAVTQFQESDARRAFPCIDHPLYKATFAFVLIIDPHLTPITNMPPASEIYTDNGKKQVEFQQTPVMSTYLLFFGIGEFRILVDDLDRRVRAAVFPEMESQVRYGLAFARKALYYCENYYRIPYPLPKIDLVAVPDFAFGAMENWGAITFRENLLLYDPKNTDTESEERICEVIAHEMAHQWFGNLVTPSDWKYLWLNESFATYFGYGVIDHYHPDWQIWDSFIESQVEPAMNRDALSETLPIEIPGGDHVVINSATAPIIYSKGGGILRQIEGFTGNDAFAEGLFRYLETHAYGCADSKDLWEALEAASDVPVSRIMEKWVKQAGHPLVEAARNENTLRLSQRRFSFLPMQEDDTVWPIPMSIRLFDANGGQRRITPPFDGKNIAIDLDPDVIAYKINDGHNGFYRTCYADADNWRHLCRMVQDRSLSASDRRGLISDRFALVKAGLLDANECIADLGHFSDETEPLPLSSILDSLFFLYLVYGEKPREKIRKTMADFLESTFARTGYLPEEKDTHGMLRLKNKALWYGVLLAMPEALQTAAQQFDRLVSGREVHPDICRAVLQAGAFLDGDKAFDWFAYRLETSTSEQERQNILRGMGCFAQDDLIERAKQVVLAEVPQRNMHLPVAWMAMNPHAKDTLWDWFTGNLPELRKIHPIIFERIIVAITPHGSLERHEEIRRFLNTMAGEKPLFAPAIRMSLAKREVCLRLRT
ncbi:MAG: M1 family metallopeptidase [Thermodesulfobacteriota bacterium]